MRGRLYSKKNVNMKERARIILERRGAGVAARMCWIEVKSKRRKAWTFQTLCIYEKTDIPEELEILCE